MFICLLLLHMLSTIQFDNQLPVWTTEINDITTHRILTTKLFTLQLARPQT